MKTVVINGLKGEKTLSTLKKCPKMKTILENASLQLNYTLYRHRAL